MPSELYCGPKSKSYALQDLEYLTKSMQRNCNGAYDKQQLNIASSNYVFNIKRAASNAPNYYDSSIKRKN